MAFAGRKDGKTRRRSKPKLNRYDPNNPSYATVHAKKLNKKLLEENQESPDQESQPQNDITNQTTVSS